MNPSQIVLKMFAVSLDTSRECNAATTIKWSSFLRSTNSLCFSSARRHYYVSGKGITQALLEVQLAIPVVS